jgi:hypothetical protein
MSLDSRSSRIRRGLSPEINHIVEIGRTNVVLSSQQSAIRRTLFDSSISSFFPSFVIHKMASSGGTSGTGSATSSQSSSSSGIGSLYSHHIPIQSTTNPTKVIKKYGIFSSKKTPQPHHGMCPLLLTYHLLLVHFLNLNNIFLGFQEITLSIQKNTWWNFLMLFIT